MKMTKRERLETEFSRMIAGDYRTLPGPKTARQRMLEEKAAMFASEEALREFFSMGARRPARRQIRRTPAFA